MSQANFLSTHMSLSHAMLMYDLCRCNGVGLNKEYLLLSSSCTGIISSSAQSEHWTLLQVGFICNSLYGDQPARLAQEASRQII